MKFILMMHATKQQRSGVDEAGNWAIFSWPKAAMTKHMEFLNALNADLEKRGVLVSISALAAPAEARLVKARGKTVPITDGPFAESKEFLAGWWMIDVKNVEEACEIAARASAAPGPDGEPLNMEIEVRQLMG